MEAQALGLAGEPRRRVGRRPCPRRPWQSINTQQAQIGRRIDQGLRQGSLTRGEAMRLRSDFRNIARLETRYRRSEARLTVASGRTWMPVWPR
jgi:hypothetical protein